LGIERSRNAVRFDFAQRTVFNNVIAQKGITVSNRAKQSNKKGEKMHNVKRLLQVAIGVQSKLQLQ
jgi:hypothetical protein